MQPGIEPVRDYFMNLQDEIVSALEALDGQVEFLKEEVPGENGALSRPRVLEAGAQIDKAAVQFTHSKGASRPPAATARNPHLAGHSFEATAISLIVHPVNPFVPTTHANLRFFIADKDGVGAIWWFGGGYDLTPYYGFAEDAVHWHQTAAAATGAHYDRCKKWCDDYFFLPHRSEPRGIGGVFFDDWNAAAFEDCFGFVQRVGDSYLPAYLPILERRLPMAYGERQREWQLYRRGRYVEFNLLYDRGTKYGVQSGRRIEAVLASMPPRVRWGYNIQPEPGSPEAALMSDFLRPRDWVGFGMKSA